MRWGGEGEERVCMSEGALGRPGRLGNLTKIRKTCNVRTYEDMIAPVLLVLNSRLHDLIQLGRCRL